MTLEDDGRWHWHAVTGAQTVSAPAGTLITGVAATEQEANRAILAIESGRDPESVNGAHCPECGNEILFWGHNCTKHTPAPASRPTTDGQHARRSTYRRPSDHRQPKG